MKIPKELNDIAFKHPEIVSRMEVFYERGTYNNQKWNKLQNTSL